MSETTSDVLPETIDVIIPPATGVAMVHYYATIALDGTITNPGQAAAGEVVPPGATVITREQCQTIIAVLERGGHCTMVNGTLLPELPVVPVPVNLAAAKASAFVLIDDAAEKARLNFLTSGSGQAMEYEATSAEAVAALRMAMSLAMNAVADTTLARVTDPDAPAVIPAPLRPADYPWLNAERLALEAVGQSFTIEQIATVVKATTDAWTEAGAEIKRVRRTAKLAITGATTTSGIDAVVADLVWPTPPSE